MASLIVQQRVREYAVLRPAFDAHGASRAGARITTARGYRGADDPNDIVLLFDVANPATARSWIGGQDLKAAMEAAGVLGPPVFHCDH